MFSTLRRRVKPRVGFVRTLMDEVRSDFDVLITDIHVDSLKFIDSVRIEGYFNHKKMIINIDTIKNR